MAERTKTTDLSGHGRAFTAADFRVPRTYLSLLLGPEAAAERLGDGPGASGVVPSMLFLNICLEHMRLSGDEAFGVAPTRVAPGTFGLMIAAAAQGDSFVEALQRFAAAAPVLRPDLDIRFSRARRGLTLSFGYKGPRDARRDLALEIFVLSAHCGFRWLTGRRLTPAFLQTPCPLPPLGPTVLRPVVSPVVRLGGAAVVLGYAHEDAGASLRPVKYRRWAAHELGEFNALLDEAAASLSSDRAPGPPDVVAEVRAAIGVANWDETAVARRLGMSTATLRRRLSEAGVSFRGISGDLRRQAAATLLETGDSLDDIAARLGFSDARSFRRACHGWFGMAPSLYRRPSGTGE